MVRYVPYLLAGILLVVMLMSGLRQREEELLQKSYKPKVEQTLPDFTFKTLDGRELKLSHLRGKVVLVNFWATWCPPCKEEMPIFEREYRRCKDKGFEVLAVNMDSSQAVLERFLKENTYSFRVVRTSEEVERELKLTGFPTSYLLDREGRVYRIRLGLYKELDKDLKELLGC
ncbi:MAG: TlpA family protein disulfide reductase [Aquificaceae bacterium]|nr:TlpA family protein disulfide reductase [Aquificaceae bacterium]MCS7196695.1 TlpA family protein disulfide reductase [Aquificaceae bacterium]MCX7989794.1 TlpA family protein disulfide reductase [Aquificaceae bacterium]MDW8032609.1 TlpA disulfide reductase family protein [Aquificaceae bacterium]MDW8294005.1 TlpA disulfide reductase family protein [Aquificaceae bacterium]